MKARIIFLIMSLTLFSLTTRVEGQESANSILAKVDKTLFAPKDKCAEVKMIMTDLKNGKQKVKKAVLMQKDTDKKFFRYTYPKSVSGITTLSLPDNEVYLYLPLFKNPKRVTNLAEKNKFNHSDFSYQDMATKSYVKKYVAELIERNDTAYVLKLIPKDSKSTYSFLVTTINKKYYYPEKTEYYNKKQQKIKVAIYHYKKVGYHWIANDITMTDISKNHSTEVILTNIRLDTGLKDNLFSVENMKSKLPGTPES